MRVAGEPRFRHDRPGTPADHWRRELARRDPPLLALPADPATRLVVLAAHPDDESLGAGGLLHRAHREGWRVDVVVATAGESSHPDSPTHAPADLAALRREELVRSVAATAPGAGVHWGGLADGRVADGVEELTRLLVGVIGREGERTLLVAPWRSDGHPDHEAAGRAAATAAHRTAATLLEYPVWAWHWADASVLPWPRLRRLPLEPGDREAKQAGIRAHRSQVAPLSPDAGDGPVLTEEMLAHFAGDEVFVCDPVEPDDALERLHRDEEDPWSTEESWYERRKRAVTLAALPRPRYEQGLEVGCSIGTLTAELASRCDGLLGVDQSPSALRRAAVRLDGVPNVRLERADLPAEWPDGRFDLIVVSEVGYFLSPPALRELARRTVEALADGGHVLLCHWRHPIEGWPLDAQAVHAEFLAHDLEVLVEHVEEDFVVQVLCRDPVTPR